MYSSSKVPTCSMKHKLSTYRDVELYLRNIFFCFFHFRRHLSGGRLQSSDSEQQGGFLFIYTIHYLLVVYLASLSGIVGFNIRHPFSLDTFGHCIIYNRHCIRSVDIVEQLRKNVY
jgi:hypothetical protein